MHENSYRLYYLIQNSDTEKYVVLKQTEASRKNGTECVLKNMKILIVSWLSTEDFVRVIFDLNWLYDKKT